MRVRFALGWATCVTCCCLAGPPEAPGASLLYPRGSVAARTERLTIAGSLLPGEAPSAVLNGRPVALQPQPDGTFLKILTLAPGQNRLEFGGQTVEIARLAEGETAPAGFREQRVHSPAAEGCSDCHRLETPGDFTLVAKLPALCANCHDDPAKPGDDRRVHSPVGDGDCLACHDPHSSFQAKLLTKPQPELCVECHDGVLASGGGESNHAPAEEGCTGCHEPHSGGGKALLKKETGPLCFTCHEEVAAARPKSGGSGHEPVGKNECGKCHAPHKGPAKLLTRKVPDLCTGCHKLLRGRPDGSVHPPVADGECTSCHRVHGSSERKLLRASTAKLCGECHDAFEGAVIHAPIAGEESCLTCHSAHEGLKSHLLPCTTMPLCVACHGDLRVLSNGAPAASVHRPIERYDCLGCHTPHAGKKKLLISDPPALCTSCHPALLNDPENKPLAYLHTPVREGCSDCHRSHAARRPKLLAQEGRSLCLSCHEDPGANDGKPWSFSHQPLEGECRACHSPHGSAYKGALVKEVNELCSECHRDAPHRHPVKTSETARAGTGSIRFPEGLVLTSANELPCTTCHSPHGSDEPGMFPTIRSQLCKSCHLGAIFK